jgi:hypothetical protein
VFSRQEMLREVSRVLFCPVVLLWGSSGLTGKKSDIMGIE